MRRTTSWQAGNVALPRQNPSCPGTAGVQLLQAAARGPAGGEIAPHRRLPCAL